MIFNLGVFNIVDGKADEALEALTELSGASYTDPGCYAYQIGRDINGGNTFYTIEVWDGTANLDEHMKTEHIKKFDAKASGFLAEPPAVTTVVM